MQVYLRRIGGFAAFAFFIMISGSRPVLAAQARYALDPVGSSIHFDAKATTHEFGGDAAGLSGTLMWDETAKTIGAGTIVRIPVGDLTTHVAKRDHSMRRMFESKEFPVIEFEAVKVGPSDVASTDGGVRYRLEGTLKIRRIEYPVTIEVSALDLPEGLAVTGSVPLLIDWFELKPPSAFGLIKVLPEVKVEFKSIWKKA